MVVAHRICPLSVVAPWQSGRPTPVASALLLLVAATMVPMQVTDVEEWAAVVLKASEAGMVVAAASLVVCVVWAATFFATK